MMRFLSYCLRRCRDAVPQSVGAAVASSILTPEICYIYLLLCVFSCLKQNTPTAYYDKFIKMWGTEKDVLRWLTPGL